MKGIKKFGAQKGATKKGKLPVTRLITKDHSIYPFYFNEEGKARPVEETKAMIEAISKLQSPAQQSEVTTGKATEQMFVEAQNQLDEEAKAPFADMPLSPDNANIDDLPVEEEVSIKAGEARAEGA